MPRRNEPWTQPAMLNGARYAEEEYRGCKCGSWVLAQQDSVEDGGRLHTEKRCTPKPSPEKQKAGADSAGWPLRDGPETD